MEVVAKAVSFIIQPLTLVNVAIFVEETTEEVGLVVRPVALVKTTVGPDLHAFTLANVRILLPFADVA